MPIISEKLSYGVYVVTTELDGKPKGCIANSTMQVTAEPASFAVSINHDSFTNKCIKKSGKFAISVLAVDSDPSIIGTFGFKSGETFDKFAAAPYKTVDGLPVITDSCGYIICKVTGVTETSTHTIFLGEEISSELISDREPMTYDYYHKVIKGSAPKNAPTYVASAQPQNPPADKPKRKFVCTVCGFEYEGDSLPADYVCPICGVGPEMFEEVK